MLKTICIIVILMSCLNRAALFSSALSETDLDVVRRYCQKEGVIQITAKNLLDTIVRLSAAKIRVSNTLDILRRAALVKFEDNPHLLALGISSWEGRLCLLEEENKTLNALTTDLEALNRAYSILFPTE
jgi:septation ring formation regulator EzrA